MTEASFTKRERIRIHADFKTIYKKGRKQDTEHFLIITCPNELGWRRLGVTVSKSIGTAVKRNYVKRRLREYFRLHKAQFPASSDMLIIARPGAAELKYHALREELNRIFLPLTDNNDNKTASP
jgi:ribonuclease P protein component